MKRRNTIFDRDTSIGSNVDCQQATVETTGRLSTVPFETAIAAPGKVAW